MRENFHEKWFLLRVSFTVSRVLSVVHFEILCLSGARGILFVSVCVYVPKGCFKCLVLPFHYFESVYITIIFFLTGVMPCPCVTVPCQRLWSTLAERGDGTQRSDSEENTLMLVAWTWVLFRCISMCFKILVLPCWNRNFDAHAVFVACLKAVLVVFGNVYSL